MHTKIFPVFNIKFLSHSYLWLSYIEYVLYHTLRARVHIHIPSFMHYNDKRTVPSIGSRQTYYSCSVTLLRSSCLASHSDIFFGFIHSRYTHYINIKAAKPIASWNAAYIQPQRNVYAYSPVYVCCCICVVLLMYPTETKPSG